jgi:hypothetical protein
MIYYKETSSDEYILLYLKLFINEISICKRILKLKNNLEKKEILKYHIDRWENITGEHYYTRDTHHDKYSYIFDSQTYVIKPDHRLNFYHMTGVSYQIWELIYDLIKRQDLNDFNHYKECLKYDDHLYSVLSYKIMSKMKKLH